jgi:polysulfide reductase chain C
MMHKAEMVNTQKAWGGKVAAYLFLAGGGAGAYLAAFFTALVRPELTAVIKTGLVVSLALMITGVLFLVFDLGKKFLAFLAFSRPRDSWISRGAIIITAFIIFDLTNLVTAGLYSSGLEAPGLVLGSVTAILALLTLTYTGMVLGAARPVVFWDPAFLTALFLVSGISSGIAGTVFCLSIYNLSADLAFENSLLFLALYNSFVLTAEAVVIGFYLLRMYQNTRARASVCLVVRGNLAPPFWGLVVAGLLVSMAFDYCIAYLSVPMSTPLAAAVLPVSLAGLSSGLMLRYIVVSAGISLPLNVEGLPVYFPKITRGEFYIKD